MSVENIARKTIEYLEIPAVVGHEGLFMDYLIKEFTALGLCVFPHDGLLEIHGKTPLSAIISAHIDRHGLISIGGNEYAYAAQYMKEIKYGEPNISSKVILENIIDRFVGEILYAYDSQTGETLGKGEIELCSKLTDTGEAIFRVKGMEDVKPETPLGYDRKATYQNGQLSGQIDNAVSIATVHELFKNGYQGTALLTIEEEIGKSWIPIAMFLEEYQLETKNLLILDTSPYQNEDFLGEGRVIFRNRDFSEVFNPDLLPILIATCESLGLPYQIKDEYLLSQGKTVEQLGSTELGRLIQATDNYWTGTTVQLPTISYHTSNETTSNDALRSFFTFLKHILIDEPLETLNVYCPPDHPYMSQIKNRIS